MSFYVPLCVVTVVAAWPGIPFSCVNLLHGKEEQKVPARRLQLTAIVSVPCFFLGGLW
jgi:hypothetical protein